MADEVSNPTVEHSINPLLERIRLPGEIHQLPSNGAFYKNGELDSSVKDGEVQVFPMTAIDEVTMRSPDLMFSGDAVEQVLARCVPQILKPRLLLAKDVDFLLAVLRKVSYGETFEVTVKHICKDAKEHTYNVPMDQFIKTAKKIEPGTITKNFHVKMPNDQIVVIHPIRYNDVIKMMQAMDEDISTEARAARVVDVLVYMTEKIDDISDPKLIHEWYMNIPVGWSDHINAAIDGAADWGPDFTFKTKCKDCGEEFELDAPLNPVSFFF